MALEKDVNSYATVAEADAYFADRLSGASWASISPEMKAKALISATQKLDEMRWKNSAIASDQPLAFPRTGSYFDKRMGAYIPMTPTPNAIRISAIEMALFLLENPDSQETGSYVKELKVGPIELKGLERTSKQPSVVQNALADMLDGSGRQWWRAN